MWTHCIMQKHGTAPVQEIAASPAIKLIERQPQGIKHVRGFSWCIYAWTPNFFPSYSRHYHSPGPCCSWNWTLYHLEFLITINNVSVVSYVYWNVIKCSWIIKWYSHISTNRNVNICAVWLKYYVLSRIIQNYFAFLAYCKMLSRTQYAIREIMLFLIILQQ